MRGWRNDVLLKPDVALRIRKSDAAVVYGNQETGKRSLRRVLVLGFGGLAMRAQEQRNSLSLRQTGIPGCPQSVAIFPIEMMIPYPEAGRILLEMIAQPDRGFKEFIFAGGICAPARQIVISQSPLCDCNRVVLQSDAAAVIEHGDAICVVVTGIICLRFEAHVVLAQFAYSRVRVFLRDLVPERQLAFAGR